MGCCGTGDLVACQPLPVYDAPRQRFPPLPSNRHAPPTRFRPDRPRRNLPPSAARNARPAIRRSTLRTRFHRRSSYRASLAPAFRSLLAQAVPSRARFRNRLHRPSLPPDRHRHLRQPLHAAPVPSLLRDSIFPPRASTPCSKSNRPSRANGSATPPKRRRRCDHSAALRYP